MVATSKVCWAPRKLQATTVQETAVQPLGKQTDQHGCVTQIDLSWLSAGNGKTECFVIYSSRTCEHFQLTNEDAACMEADGTISTVNLLPVTAASSRTLKRRFRRQRCRHRTRVLEQFPQMDFSGPQDW
mmetsp:Transcript_364/g.709  ORF Transcript_364/g.709 Transcript_364/m.709 type:complete len:129 (+) Transcript_364:62-448(+)